MSCYSNISTEFSKENVKRLNKVTTTVQGSDKFNFLRLNCFQNHYYAKPDIKIKPILFAHLFYYPI